MKAKIFCTAALLSALVLGGTVSLAAPGDPMTTNGHVTVEDGSIDPGDGVTDPEKPDTKLPPIDEVKPNPNPTMGPLEISHAPELQFGTVKTATKNVTAKAKANKFGAEGSEEVRGAILQFGDLRTDVNGYTVQAKLTKQFTQDTNVLTGSTITFTNPHSATPEGSTGTAPTFEETVTLSLNDSALIATAAKADKSGKGMWVVEYGSSDAIGDKTDTTGESVELLIPANTASSMAGGDYEADVEWSITAAP